MTTYEPLQPIDRSEAERAFARGDARSVADALLRLALHEPDRRWVERWCLDLASHPDADVRRAVALSFGHLARLHGVLDTSSVLPTLRALASDPAVAGSVEDALDDIQTFTGERVTAA